MIDLEKKSAIDSDNMQVQHQATYRELKASLNWNEIIQYVVGVGG